MYEVDWYAGWETAPKANYGDPEMRFDMWEWAKWKHPRTTQFLNHLIAIDFADRYDALCLAHSKRGEKVLAPVRHEAIQNVGRPMYWSRLWHRYLWREAWREPSGLPEYVAIGLDIRINARVELELLFVTPDGHLSGPFHRYLKQIRGMTKPDYKHNNPAPRVGSFDELPAILTECLALYDDIANALKGDTWWELKPKPWLYDKSVRHLYENPEEKKAA